MIGLSNFRFRLTLKRREKRADLLKAGGACNWVCLGWAGLLTSQ